MQCHKLTLLQVVHFGASWLVFNGRLGRCTLLDLHACSQEAVVTMLPCQSLLQCVHVNPSYNVFMPNTADPKRMCCSQQSRRDSTGCGLSDALMSSDGCGLQ